MARWVICGDFEGVTEEGREVSMRLLSGPPEIGMILGKCLSVGSGIMLSNRLKHACPSQAPSGELDYDLSLF